MTTKNAAYELARKFCETHKCTGPDALSAADELRQALPSLIGTPPTTRLKSGHRYELEGPPSADNPNPALTVVTYHGEGWHQKIIFKYDCTSIFAHEPYNIYDLIRRSLRELNDTELNDPEVNDPEVNDPAGTQTRKLSPEDLDELREAKATIETYIQSSIPEDAITTTPPAHIARPGEHY